MNRSVMSFVLVAVSLALSSANASDFSGSYAGIKVGTNRADTSGLWDTSSENSTTRGLQGGHGWDIGNNLLGLDGFYDKNSEETHTPFSQYGSNIYGLDMKLGMPINKVMPYAKLGFARADGTGSLVNFDDNRVHGGLGLEYKLAPSWGIAGEWTKSSHRESGITLNNDNFTVGLNYYFSQPKVASAPAIRKVPAAQPKEAWKTIVEEKVIRIEGANFDTDSAKLKPSADAKLQEVVELAREYPDATFDVSGYTDSTASREYNLTLSKNRAESVKAYLVARGVDADRIVARGFGVDNPIGDNETAEGRALNRRVEVRYTIREEKKVRVTE